MNAARRHWAAAIAGTIGVAASLAFVQVLAARTGWRVDLTPERRAVLSDHARRVLAGLYRPVEITAFLRADDPRNRDIEDLLARVGAASPLVRHRLVDLNRNPALARAYGVDAYGSVVVESDGRRRDFPNPDEQALMAAIIQVTRPGRRRVYALTGNGERGLRDRDRQAGYSSAAVALINERYEVDEIRLDAHTPVPDDAAALIVAGPRRDVPPAAVRHIDAYVRRGGGLLALLDPGDAPSLAALLRRYGVTASDEIVLDDQQRLFAGDYLTMLVPGRSPAHPVSARLSAAPLMSGARAVRAVPTDSTEEAVDVLATSADSWRTSDLSALHAGAGAFVPGRDTRGPVPVGAAATVRTPSGRPGRVLVYGDADFAANLLLDYLGNRDLLLNSVNWLAGEEDLVASRPPAKAPGVQQLFLSARQGQLVLWLGAVVLPAAVLAAGLTGVALRRRGA